MMSIGLLLAEPHSSLVVADGYDLSEVIFDLSAVATVVMGMLLVVATINRLSSQLRQISERADSPPRVRLRMAREARLRAAWMLIVGTSLILLGVALVILAEDALVTGPPDAAGIVGPLLLATQASAVVRA